MQFLSLFMLNQSIHFKHFILHFVVLIYCSFHLIASNYTFQVFDAKNGLNAPEVTHVLSTKNAFIWIAGVDGLTRYDGKKFLNFNKSYGLNTSQILCIAEGEKGAVICGTKKGISIFNGVNYLKIPMLENKNAKASDQFVKCIYKTSKNELYVGCVNGLFKYNRTLKKCIRITAIKEFVLSIVETAKNEVFITTENNVYSLKNGKVTKLIFASKKSITTIIPFYKNYYWVGTTNGVVLCQRFRNRLLPQRSYGDQPIVNSLLLKNNTFVFTTKMGTIYLIKQRKLHTIDLSQQIMPLDITAIAEDFQGNCWITTSLGLIKMLSSDFNTPSYANLLNAPVASIASDQNGTIYYGTTDGLKVVKNNEVKTFHISDLPTDNFISALSFCDKKLYLGTFSGDVYLFEKERFQLIYSAKKRDCCIYSILHPTTNEFWISTGYNVIHLKNNQVKTYKFSSQYTQQILRDHSNQLWCANMTKLKVIRNGKLHNAPKPFDAFDNFVTIVEDANKTIWVGTFGNGLLRYSKGKITAITTAQGLSNNYITSTFFDRKQHCLWVGTSYGLSKISLKKHSEISSIQNYLNEQARENYSCVQNAIGQLPSGNVLVSVGEEIIEFVANPSQVKSHSPKLPVYIASIRLNKKELYSSSKSKLVQQHVFKASENNFDFNFNAIDFHSPQSVRFAWKLKGYDKDWSSFTENNYTSYTNLPYGHYTLYLAVKNQMGSITQSVPFTFTIALPFYLEWWFLIIAFSIPIGLIVLFLKNRINKIKKQEADKTANYKKLAEAELKTLRAQMNPHFMFNTLNAIQEIVLSGNDELSRIYFADFAKMMRMILHNSTEKFITLEKEIDFLQLYLKFEMIRFRDKFKVVFTVDPKIEPFNIRIPGMIIQPIIENAINHGLLHRKEGGILEINIDEVRENGKNYLVCCVQDNGIGLNNAQSLKKEEGHQSISSMITKERIEILNMIYGEGKYSLTINEIEDYGNYKGTKVVLKIEI